MPTNTGKIIADLPKEIEWNQTELATNSEVIQEMIGKYEGGEAVPSIEEAKKISDAFGVSPDYLVGEGMNASCDKKTLKRLQDIHKFNKDVQDFFSLLIL